MISIHFTYLYCIIKHKKRTLMKKHKRFFYLLFLVMVNTILIHAQQTININSGNLKNNQPVLANDYPSILLKKDSKRSRYFDYNKNLKNITLENIGDTLLLDFFSDKTYKAVIINVTKDIDGIIGITSQITNTKFGYCYISVSDKGITLSGELPTTDEHFFAAHINGNTYLSESTMSNMKKNELENSDPIIPKTNSSNNKSINYNTLVKSANNSISVNNDINEDITIDLLVVYTFAAERWAYSDYSVSDIDDLINIAIQKSNLALANSNTGITFRVAHKHKTDYIESNTSEDLYRLQKVGDGYLDEVHTLRSKYKADIVVLIPEVDFTGGVAYLLNDEEGFPTWAFALTRVQQTSFTYTLVHEIGHNMGCGHHKAQSTQPGPGIFPYSAGWRGTTQQSTKYATIMTYEEGSYFPDGQNHIRIPYFSSPEITFEGVTIGNVDDGNNTLTLKQTKHVTSQYSEVLYDVTLNTLFLNKGVLSPIFNPDTTEYTVNLPNKESELTIIGIANSLYSEVTGNGNNPIAVGSNTISIDVTSGDSTLTNTYSIKVVRADLNASADADLKEFLCSTGALTPTFSPNITEYTINVPMSVTSITITGTPNDSKATVTGNRTNEVLSEGNNIFEFIVVAENGVATKNYTVNVKRNPSSDATLSNLSCDKGELYPEFSPNVTEYIINVNEDVNSITVVGTANHDSATVIGNAHELTINKGLTDIKIIVIAEDKITTKEYKITVNCTDSAYSDATLKEITLSSGTLTPEFNSETLKYTVNDIPSNINSISITGIPSIETAEVSGNVTDMTLLTGVNTVTLTVTARDKVTTKSYEIDVVMMPIKDFLDVTNDNGVAVYPNPVSDILFINSDIKIQSIIILDQNGSQVKHITDFKESIDLNDLKKGLYIIQLETEKGQIAYKITKL